jgi:hypothetical protein
MDCITSRGRTTDEGQIGKDFEGSDRGLFKVLFWLLLEGLKKTTKPLFRVAGVPAKILAEHFRE